MPPPATPASGPSPEVEAYLGTAPEASRARLRAVVDVIRAEAPQATERMAYAMPPWHLGENLVHVAGYARHVGLYPGSGALVEFAAELAGFATSKGAIQFPHDRDLPLDLVRRITRWRVDQVAPPVVGRPTRAVTALRDPGPITFDAVLHRSDSSGAACFVDFPLDQKSTFGKGNLVPVRALWDGHAEYFGALAMMGGTRAMLLCRKDVLAQLGKGPGETVHVSIVLDLAPREVEVPHALGEALDATSGARAAWDALSPSARREYAAWVEEAKRDATRDTRVAKAVPSILAGKRLRG